MPINFNRWLDAALKPYVAIMVSCIGLILLVRVENQIVSVPFVAAIIALLASLLFLATSRFAFSLYAAWAFASVITVISVFKFRAKGFGLHFYDVVFVGGDPEIYSFLIGTFPHLVALVLALSLLAVAIFVIAYQRVAPSAVGRGSRGIILTLTAAALPFTLPAEAAGDHRYFYYLGGHHASSFFVSLLDFKYVVSRTSSLERLAQLKPTSPIGDKADCRESETKPDVFVVLQESQIDLKILPQLGVPHVSVASTLSRGEQKQALTVETFGGGTWISNLSMMTGLSSADFGWRSPYLTVTLDGKVRGSLPHVLAACGYRTAAILPMKYTFVNEGPFLKSIGFETVLDADAIGATDFIHRDSLYFSAAETFIAAHRETDDRPLFLLVETMFPHSPYTTRMEPNLKVPGEPLHSDPELAEYLRRVTVSQSDFGAFLDAREAEPSQRGSVVLEFGDHQSYATKPLVDEIAGPSSLSDLGSLAYRTYFALHSFDYELNVDSSADLPIDIAYLGAHLLEQARLPTSPVFRDLVRLRKLCNGRFRACIPRDEVDRHLRRRIDAGLLDILDEPISQRKEVPLLPGPSVAHR